MKQTLLIILLAGFCITASAKHITGGEIIYDYVGPGASAGTKSYRITLRLFRDDNCFSCAVMPPNVIIGVFDNGTRQPLVFQNIALSLGQGLPLNTLPSCITNPPTLEYTAGYYAFTMDLPDNALGYTAAYQTCCRIDEIQNVPNSIGATYTTVIPGALSLAGAGTDNSPRFSEAISVVCYNKPFTLNFSATDPDGDVLVYSLCSAYSGGGVNNANPANPAPPPYGFLSYMNGYSGIQPLGDRATIDPQTGIISGIAPGAGRYVVSVCVESFNPVTREFKSEHRKDFIVTVAPCDFAGAQLLPSYLSCDGFSFDFVNFNTSPLNETFFWDFGDGTTSNQETPSHTYTTAGVYDLKLVINRGGSCSDSTTSKLSVFPGYFPGITDNGPMCKGLPVQFRDATTATYGNVNYWRWDFGNTGAFNDTSRLREPTYSYATTGSYDVTLIVGSDKGCIDTIVKKVAIVDKPAFAVTNDTLICAIDTLQLSAVGNSGGSVTWSPNYMINNVNSLTPLVSPDVTTTYRALYTDGFGCVGLDSVTVRVVTEVTLRAGNDTSICRTDSARLTVASDALQYSWTPAATLNNPSAKLPIATPTAATTVYRVVGNIGKCTKEDDVVVRTVPYPVANAGKDTAICYGNSVQLQATGGSIYSWSPRSYLNNSSISNPLSQRPGESIRYVVTVRDTLGCPKGVNDTVLVAVTRIIANAGPADTNVVLGQPLQLTATGSANYSWSPATWLNNPAIFNPLSLPEDNIQYVVRVSDDKGCFGIDTINVKVFKIDPDLLVPTGFSPNADGVNDVFKPILVGMRSLDVFTVYNRWGQLVYSTTQTETGWDGTIGGVQQGTATFVWRAEGTNYLGQKIKKTGTVILIR